MGALIKGVGDWRRITWLPNGDETLIGRELTGTLRHLTDTEGTGSTATAAGGSNTTATVDNSRASAGDGGDRNT